MTHKRDDPELAARYQKDPAQEAFLGRFNDLLRPLQEAEYDPTLPELHPTVQIVGVPRSGTTLLTQLIGAHLDVGAISNLAAAFWAAPCFGLRLARKLLPQDRTSSYEADYGRTKDLSEPHEFGYFWSELLGYRDMRAPTDEDRARVDWDRVRTVLVNMTHAHGGPLVFKSFMFGFHATAAVQVLPRTLFIHVQRDPVQNALSVLHMRERYGATAQTWVSIKPPEYEQLRHSDLATQVAGQVVYGDQAYARELARCPPDNVLTVNYAQLCQDPRALLSRVRDRLNALGGSLPAPTAAPRRFDVRQHAPGTDEEHAVTGAVAALTTP